MARFFSSKLKLIRRGSEFFILIFFNGLRVSDMNITQEDLMKYGLAAGVIFAVYKFGPTKFAKPVAIAMAGAVAASNLPYVSAVI